MASILPGRRHRPKILLSGQIPRNSTSVYPSLPPVPERIGVFCPPSLDLQSVAKPSSGMEMGALSISIEIVDIIG